MYIIAGLGNPGREYENTRHNAGFASLDALAKRHGIELTTRKFQALTGSGYIDGQAADIYELKRREPARGLRLFQSRSGGGADRHL